MRFGSYHENADHSERESGECGHTVSLVTKQEAMNAQLLHFIQFLSSACEIVTLTVQMKFLIATSFLSVISHNHYHELVYRVTPVSFKLRINIKHYSGLILTEEKKTSLFHIILY